MVCGEDVNSISNGTVFPYPAIGIAPDIDGSVDSSVIADVNIRTFQDRIEGDADFLAKFNQKATFWISGWFLIHCSISGQ